MIKHILKQIWVERRQNAWMMLELSIVFFFFLVVSDFLWIKVKNYAEPTGFDIEDTFVLNLKRLETAAALYVDPTTNDLTPLDELQQLMNNIRQYPDVEYVSASLYSAPYSMGGYWRSVMADTTRISEGLRVRPVTADYFDLFRIRGYNGNPLRFEEGSHSQIILTEDLALTLFDSVDRAIGQTVYFNGSDPESAARVVGVSTRYKRQDFFPYEPTCFQIVDDPDLNNRASAGQLGMLDLCLRVKPGTAARFREQFETTMGDRLRVNNLYVASVTPGSKLKDDVVGTMWRVEVVPMLYVLLFVLITVFLGVFGSFFLRTRQRFGEIGIRIAVGASPADVRRFMTVEALCLVLLTVLPGFVVYINLLYADVLNTYYLPISAVRIAIAFAVALVLTVIMVVGGVMWPASRAARIEPVEALRDE